MALAFGIHKGVPEADYRALDVISKSGLDSWVSGRAGIGRKGLIGSALHCRVLEGKAAFHARYAFADSDFDLRLKPGKDTMAALEAANPGKAILRPAELARVRESFIALQQHPRSAKWMAGEGDTEVTVITKLPDFDIPVKCRIDKIAGNTLTDLKSTGLAFQDEFVDAIAAFNYASQAAFYVDCYAAITKKFPPFVFVCVSGAAPAMREGHDGVWIQQITNEQLAFGRKWYRSMLALYIRYGIKEKDNEQRAGN